MPFDARHNKTDFDVRNTFTRTIMPPGVTDRAQCKNCNYERSWTTSALSKHLPNCKGRGESIEGDTTPPHAPKAQGTQQKIDFKAQFGANSKTQLHQMFSRAVFTSCVSFSLFESEEWKDFFKQLGYTPYSRQTLASTALDQDYQRLSTEVQKKVNACDDIGLVVDESTNIAGDRIENVSMILQGTAYHWRSSSLEDRDATAESTVESIVKVVKELTNSDVNRISFIATDTCPTQHSVWKKLHAIPEFAHVLFIGCDAHGIQLIFKDLLDPGQDESKQVIPSTLRLFWRQFQSVVSFFSRSKKQAAILHKKQEKAGMQHHTSIAAAGMTRWGTQFFSIDSLIKNEASITLYTCDPRSEIPDAIRVLLLDSSFWSKLRSLKTVFEPIHEEQKISESMGSTLTMVYPRWIKIEAHLRAMAITGDNLWAHEVDAYLKRSSAGFTERMRRQVNPIHALAFLLNPTNRAQWHTLERQKQNEVRDFLEDYAGKTAVKQFYDYIDQCGHYDSVNRFWGYADDIKFFWRIARSAGEELSLLATRVVKATANSVASERAFSVQNILHTKARNRLSWQKVDKITFIYINSRSLRSDRTEEKIREENRKNNANTRREERRNKAQLEDDRLLEEENSFMELENTITASIQERLSIYDDSFDFDTTVEPHERPYRHRIVPSFDSNPQYDPARHFPSQFNDDTQYDEQLASQLVEHEFINEQRYIENDGNANGWI